MQGVPAQFVHVGCDFSGPLPFATALCANPIFDAKLGNLLFDLMGASFYPVNQRFQIDVVGSGSVDSVGGSEGQREKRRRRYMCCVYTYNHTCVLQNN